MKWCEVGPEKSLRNEFLSQYLLQRSIKQEYVHLELNKENFKEEIQKIEKEYGAVRIHPLLWGVASQSVSKAFRELIRIGSVDSITLSRGQFWPDNFFREAVVQALTIKVKNIDVSQMGLIIGTNGVVRSLAAALVRLGFSKINIIDPEDQDAQEIIRDLSDIFFNTQFKNIPKDDLTLLPGVHGIVANTLLFDTHESFLNDLYYFNFLKKGGVVLDISDVPVEPPFIHIGKDIGATAVLGFEVNSYFDKLWVKKVFDYDLDLKDYEASLKTALEKAPYNKDQYQKVLEEFQVK